MKPEFQIVRKKYEGELAQAEARVNVLKSKIQLLDEVGADVENGSLNFSGPDYSQMGLKAATLDALEKMNAAISPVGIADVAKFLAEHRYRVTGPTLTSGLNTTLRRLAAPENNKVVIAGEGRNKRYQLKKL